METIISFLVVCLIGVYSYRKKLMRKNRKSSAGIMNSTMNSTMIDGMSASYLLGYLNSQHNFDNETLRNLQQMNFEQLQHFALENDLMNVERMNQLMNDMQNQFNPYLNPGLDVMIDEAYHGLDHGLGIVHDHNMDMMNDINNINQMNDMNNMNNMHNF